MFVFAVGITQLFIGRDRKGIFGVAPRYENDLVYEDIKYQNIGIIGQRRVIERFEKVLIYIAHRLGIYCGDLHDAGTLCANWGEFNGLTCIYFATLRSKSCKNYFSRRIIPFFTNVPLFVAEIQNLLTDKYDFHHLCNLCGVFVNKIQSVHTQSCHANGLISHSVGGNAKSKDMVKMALGLNDEHKDMFQIADLVLYFKRIEMLIGVVSHVMFSLNYIGTLYPSDSDGANSNDSKAECGFFDRLRGSVWTCNVTARVCKIKCLRALLTNYYIQFAKHNYQSFLITE